MAASEAAKEAVYLGSFLGELDGHEVGQLLEEIMPRATQKELKYLRAQLDADGDGQTDPEDLKGRFSVTKKNDPDRIADRVKKAKLKT